MTGGSSQPPAGSAAADGELVVVGTPIGNLEDLTHRAARTLAEVDLVAAEDTRTARKLLSHLGLRKPTISCFTGNEAARTARLLRELSSGKRVALISESGLPGVSDPGERLIRSCVEQGVAVTLVPGPSAAISALVLSGLPTTPHTFVGFLPRQGKARRVTIEQLRLQPWTLVIYESPRRVAATLRELHAALGAREAALVRELTKLHEEVVRGTLEQLAARYGDEAPRGEVVLVVAPSQETQQLPAELIEAEIAQRLAAGESPRAIADNLRAHGRRRVYQRALELSRGSPAGGEPGGAGQS